MKKCFKCGDEKPIRDFYRHPQMGDGHLGKCKECTKRDVRVHRIVSNGPREYDRRRYRDNVQRRQAAAARCKNERLVNPLEYRARYMVRNAVRDGRLDKPDCCSICRRATQLHGHHEDYTKPLDVMWLCVQCHQGRHANMVLK